MAVQCVAQKNRAPSKVHSGKNDQDTIFITFLTFIEKREKVKRNEDSGKDTHEVAAREETARKHSIIFKKRRDATEFVKINGFQVKG